MIFDIRPNDEMQDSATPWLPQLGNPQSKVALFSEVTNVDNRIALRIRWLSPM
jgi:hypothetical protein